MAKQLYDYWFVQFDFPDENGKPYKSSGGKMVWNKKLKREIPEGWSDGCFSDIANITMGQSPDGSSYNEDGNGVIFYQGSTDFGIRFPSVRMYTTAPTRFAKCGDILMSVRAPVGAVNIANTDCCIGRGLSAINAKIGSITYIYFVIHYLKVRFDNLNSMGTTFGSITKDELNGLPVVVPSDDVLKSFESVSKPIFDMQMNIGQEIEGQTLLHDELLPLLMNGQVSVKQLNNDLAASNSENAYQYLTINPNNQRCYHYNSLSLFFNQSLITMANFFFYRYHFVQVDEPELFSEVEDGVTDFDGHHNPRFSEDVASNAEGIRKLNLYDFKVDKKTGEQTSVQYENDILHCLDGVVMLQVRNNKHKKVIPIDQLEALDVPHYPYTLVIVDMRPGNQAILVQQKKSAFKNPDEVAHLVKDYCTRALGLPQLGLKIRLDKRLCKGSIWDVVSMRTERGQDRVKTFTLVIDKKRPNEKNEVDKALQMVLEMMCAAEGELKLSTNDDAKELLSESRENVRNMVDMLVKNKYHLKVGFERSGSVEYGSETAAIYGVDDEWCLEFMNREPHIEDREDGVYHLFGWLDMLMPEGAGYDYKESVRRKRNGRGKAACRA